MADVGKQPWYGVTAILSLILVVSVLIGGRVLEKKGSFTDGVTVKGVAEKEITADLITWRGQIVHRANDLAVGYDELQKQFATTINFLLQQGVTAEESIEEGPLQARYQGSRHLGNREPHAHPDIHCNDDRRRLGQGVHTTHPRGHRVSLLPGKFLLHQARGEGLKLDLLEQAAENAQLRAKRLARSSGNRVAKIISVSQGIFHINRPNSTETAS